MKNLILIIATLVLIQVCNAQTDSLYLGQVPPGNTPKIFAPGIVCKSNIYEEYCLWSYDVSEFYYTHTDDAWGTSVNYYTHYKDSAWTTPVVLNSNVNPGFIPDFFIDSNYTMFPFITADGQHAYIMKNNKVFMTEKVGQNWSLPVDLNLPLPYEAETWWITVTNDETIYMTLGIEAQNSYDLYRFKKVDGSYPIIESLKNTMNYSQVFFQFIAPDENYIILSMYNISGGYGQYDLWISYKRENGMWTNPKNLGSDVNTGIFDMAAYVTPDEKYIFYTRRGNAGNSDIYWMSSSIIDSLKNTNFAPYLKNRIPIQTVTVGNQFTFTISDSIFVDDDGNETLTLTAKLSNGNDLPDSLSFDPLTNQFSGKLTQAKNFNIKVTATDTAGASVSDIFALTVEPATAIENLKINNNITVFPNPASQTIQIKGIDKQLKEANYKIIDLSGKTIKQGKLNSETIDISDITKGIYLFSMHSNKRIITEKIVIE